MNRPRVKSVFPPIPLDDGIIRIGGADFGIAAEIRDDERRHVWQLLQVLDGTRSMAQLVQEMCARDPELTAADVEAAVAMLEDGGYLDDAAIAPPAVFSPDETERYRRNAEFFSFFHLPPLTGYDFQARLREAKVTVLGIGGLGSYVALALAAAGVGDLLLVDDDNVELHNLNRQVLYTDADVGSHKTVAAARRVTQANPHVAVSTLSRRVSGVSDAPSLHGGARSVDLRGGPTADPSLRVAQRSRADRAGAVGPWRQRRPHRQPVPALAGEDRLLRVRATPRLRHRARVRGHHALRHGAVG
ncbi:MAG: sulfur-carrier protein adenylyltransferase/sulfurtransferase [Micromonosporaceae bacterium]|jgi:hypothetical protein|nr:sulfur-carrier protein adenylyltransferase/sulfurtransferase [Micromonosporaceae bacterium]